MQLHGDTNRDGSLDGADIVAQPGPEKSVLAGLEWKVIKALNLHDLKLTTLVGDSDGATKGRRDPGI